MKILFICHGNICRSVMAEFILKDYIKKLNLKNIYVSSRATSKEEIGNDIYYEAKKCLIRHNINIEKHASKQITKEDYNNYDLILVMDNNNYYNTIKIVGDNKKVRLLLDREIDDPWYTRDFETCYNDIDIGIKQLLKELGE